MTARPSGQRAIPPAGDGADPGVARLDRLLQMTMDEITRADAKAATLLAGILSAGGAALAAVVATHGRSFTASSAASALWSFGIAAAVGAIAALLVALYPRAGQRWVSARHIGYFGDVVRLSSLDQLLEAVESGGVFGRTDTAAQLWRVSHIAQAKYRAITIGISGSALALACWGSALVLGA
ncbi:MAG: Pycsar system effector family protein [Chloroflexota bacterium]